MKTKRIKLHKEARDEFLRETQFYESKQVDAGRHFREAIGAAFDLIRHQPGGGKPGRAGTRKIKVKGFPFYDRVSGGDSRNRGICDFGRSAPTWILVGENKCRLVVLHCE